jgi:hypothetical protein
VKENSLAVLADGYISPMLLNTLMRQKIPALAQNERLENELKRYCPGLILLSREEAADKISKANSLVYASSEEVLPIVLESSKNPSRIENTNLFLDESKFKQTLKGIGSEYLRIPVEIYACDAYFNSRSKPVVLGIYRHPQKSEGGQMDIVYYTNAEIMREMLPRVEKFLGDISARLKIKNFPLHMDFSANGDGLVPTKISPMRFGDFSLPDLLLFAYGINSYSDYFLKREPNWQEILSGSGDETYFWVMSMLPLAPYVDWASAYQDLKPDHDEYADTFQDLIGYCKLDLKRYPAFSIAFARTKNIDEALKYLNFKFESYMKHELDEN